MTQRSVYGVMQELQQLRANVAALSEKNCQLAKALVSLVTTAKQELTKARTAQTAVFSNKVAEWMEARGKFVEVRHQAIQCSFQELDQGTCASVEDMQSEPDPPLSPHRSDSAVQMESKDYECSDGSEDAPRSDVTSSTTSATDSSGLFKASQGQGSRTFLPQRSGPSAGVNRRLRQRDDSLSYVEPKLNTKLRRGDHYGLGKRSPLRTTNQPSMTRRPLKPRVISEHRDATSAFVPSLFGQQCSPFHRRTARPVKRISYAEPKLNTKLRQGDKFTFTT